MTFLPGGSEPRRDPLGQPAAPIQPPVPQVKREVPTWAIIFAILCAVVGAAFLFTIFGGSVTPK